MEQKRFNLREGRRGAAGKKQSFWIDKLISNYPFPGGGRNVSQKAANLFVISMALPASAYAYVRIEGISPIPSFPIEPILAVVLAFYLFYGSTMMYIQGRVDSFFLRIRPVLALNRKQFDEFEQTCRNYLYKPSKMLLGFVLLLTLAANYALANSKVLQGDSVFQAFLFAMILFANLFNWIGGWSLISFHHFATQFEGGILNVNPLNPDRLGGFGPLSELVTLGVFIIGVLAALMVPFWYLFSTMVAISLVALTTVVIPVYLYLSIYRLHATLRSVKEETLATLAVELASGNGPLGSFLVKGKLKNVKHVELMRISESLEPVQRIFGTVNSMRTYPVDAQTILKVVSTMSAPIISLLLTQFAQRPWPIGP